MLSFTIDFNKAISNGTISVAANTFSVADALFTATLNNGTSVSSSTGFTDGNQNDIFTINLSDIAAGSSLTFNWELVTGGDNPNGTAFQFDNVAIAGVALNLTEAPAPEPSTWAMAALSGFALLFIRMGWVRRASR